MEEENKESQAQKIVQEDKDEVISVEEIQRIVMLYLNREPNENEVQRFEGMHERQLELYGDYIVGILRGEDRNERLNRQEVLDAGKKMIDISNEIDILRKERNKQLK